MQTWNIIHKYQADCLQVQNFSSSELLGNTIKFQQRFIPVHDHGSNYQIKFDGKKATLMINETILAEGYNTTKNGHVDGFPFEYKGDGPKTCYVVSDRMAGGRIIIFDNGVIYMVRYGSGLPIIESSLYEKVT